MTYLNWTYVNIGVRVLAHKIIRLENDSTNTKDLLKKIIIFPWKVLSVWLLVREAAE